MAKTPRKPAAAPEAMAPEDSSPEAPAGTAAEKLSVMKMKDLVAAVAKQTGGRPAAVKAAVEATVTALGEALHAGRGVNLPGFGKSKVARPAVDGKPMTLKLKPGAEKVRPRQPHEALAEDDD